MRALLIAGTGLAAQQLHIDTIAQNLANATTTGYKMVRPEFQDLIYQDLKRSGTNTTAQGTIAPVGVQIGLGVKTAAIARNTGQGSVMPTENTFDIAIQGKGYFQVTMPDGSTSYTRDGSFRLSDTGVIVTSAGYPILPAITVPNNATSININSAGVVQASIQGQVQPSQLGQMQLATFINPAGLNATGDNLFQETPASGAPLQSNPGLDGTGTLLQGFLESSNVDSVTEITGLINAQRAYEMNTKVLSAVDQMLQSLNQTA